MNVAATPGAPTPPAGGANTNQGSPEPTAIGAQPPAPPAAPAGAKPDDSQVPLVGDDFVLEMPEGIELDSDALTDFKALAAEHKLTVDQAKALGGIAIKMAQRQAEAHTAMVQGWRDEIQGDPVLGQAKLEQTLVTARKALDLAPPALKTFLNDSGLGNHPDLIRWAHAIGAKLSDDVFETSKQGGAGGKDIASLLFPTMTKQG